MDLKSEAQRTTISMRLESQTNDEIDQKLLEAYLRAEEEYGDRKRNATHPALKIKYEALTYTPTTIEKTMSPAQLYASNNSFWGYGYTARQMKDILRRLEGKQRTEENFNEAHNAMHEWFNFAQTLVNRRNKNGKK